MALDYLSPESGEVKEALSYIRETGQALKAATENYRPTIREERYLSSAEVCEYLHISLRTLQTLRDTRQIPFTLVGERIILYPENGIRETLLNNLRAVKGL